ncbi:MAG: transporter substrate-binding domain-containing protein [Methylococcus sp.]|nr:transporter substrate-binding domain-containing protein [Methylococcus sp.]
MSKLLKLSLAAALFFTALAARAEQLSVVADEWPPYVDPTAPGGGLAIDLVTAVFSRAGYTTKLMVDDWTRDLEGANIGVYDVVANIWYTDERAQYLDYSDAYLVNDVRFVKRKWTDIEFEDYSDIRGLRIGMVKNYGYPSGFLRAGGLMKIANDSLVDALTELVEGQCDLVIDDKHVLEYTAKRYLPASENRLEFLPRPVGLEQLHIAVSKANPNHAKIVDDFNRTLKAMKNDGTYGRILDAHNYQP